MEEDPSEGFDINDDSDDSKHNARVVSASMLKKMTVNKDDMLLVTKNTRGNHHVFINVTRLQQLIQSEGRMIERDPFIAYLGRLPPEQFVSGALLDKAITASLRVQGVAHAAQSTGAAQQAAKENAAAKGKKSSKRQAPSVNTEPAEKRPSTESAPSEQSAKDSKEEQEVAVPAEKGTVSEWRFTGGETLVHTVTELTQMLPTPRPAASPHFLYSSRPRPVKGMRRDATVVVGSRRPSHP